MNKQQYLGRYIVIEGLDQKLKNQALKNLEKRLQAAGLPVKIFNTPDTENDPLSKNFYHIFNSPYYLTYNQTKLALDLATDSQKNSLIETACKQGYYCLTTKNYLSLVVEAIYQKNDFQNYQLLNQTINLIIGNYQPDLIVVIDSTTNQINHDLDMPIEQIENMRTGYLMESKKRQIPIIFNHDSLENIYQNIWQQVAPIINIGYQKPNYLLGNPQLDEEKTLNHNQDQKSLTPPEANKSKDEQKQSLIDIDGHIKLFNQTINNIDDIQKILSEQVSSDAKKIFPKKQLITPKNNLILIQSTSILSSLYYLPGSNYLSTDLKRYSDYYTPKKLSEKTKVKYKEIMDKLFKNYQTLSDNPTSKNQASKVLPLSALSNNLIIFNKSSLKKQFLSNSLYDSDEFETINKGLNNLNIKLYSQPISVGSVNQIQDNNKNIEIFDRNLLGQKYNDQDRDDFKIIHFAPANELEIVSEILYNQTDLNKLQINQISNEWSFDQKSYLLKNIQKNNINYDQIKKYFIYQFEIIDSLENFLTIKELFDYIDLNHQTPTPRLGFNTDDKIFNDDQLLTIYEESFRLSLEIFSLLISKKHYFLAQYCLLKGHKLRFKIYLNLNQIIANAKMVEKINRPEITILFDKMLQQISQVHPIIYKQLLS